MSEEITVPQTTLYSFRYDGQVYVLLSDIIKLCYKASVESSEPNSKKAFALIADVLEQYKEKV